MWSTFAIVDSTDNSVEQLIALDDLKLELGLPNGSDDHDEDETLEARITRASRLLADLTERRFAFAHATETFIFDRDEFLCGPLLLRLFPIVEVESITAGDVELEADAYHVDADNGRVILVSGGWSGQIVVTYSGGYVLPDDAPMRLQDAVVALVRDARISATSGDAGTGAVRQVTHGDVSVGYYDSRSTSSADGGLPTGVAETIRFYRRPTAF